MALRQVTVLKTNYRDKKKDGSPFINKKGNPFWIAGINFRAADGSENWANAYVGEIETRDYIKGLEAGTVLNADFDKDDYGLKFDAKSLDIVSRPGVTTSQAIEQTAQAFGGTVAGQQPEIKPEDIPF